MADEAYGELLSFHDIELLVIAHYKLWIPSWLAARERKMGITVGQLSRPRSYIVKQTFTALPGQERTPAVIAVSNGFQDEPRRSGTGNYDAFLRFGIACLVMGSENQPARALAGHYQAALLGIALHQRSISDGAARLHELRDLKIDDIDEEAAGRSLCAVRIELTYKVPNFISEHPTLPIPPPDPAPPHPDDPLVEEVIVDVNKYLASEEIP